MSMKRTVLTFGLISGAVSSALALLNWSLLDRIGFDRAEVVGYTGIVLSFLLVFFGVRSYRESTGGRLTFARGLAVGLLITLISCACYVATWQVVSSYFAPDFFERYAAHSIEKLRASGASAESVEGTRRQMEEFGRMYANPFFRAAMTFLEPFPIGLLVSFVSAAVLRKK